MQSNQLKELWAIRFQKIFNLEYESFYFYRKLMRDYQKLLEDSEAEEILRKIMRDEISHARAARELIQIIKEKESDITRQNPKAPRSQMKINSDRK